MFIRLYNKLVMLAGRKWCYDPDRPYDPPVYFTFYYPTVLLVFGLLN